jgi:hypothetical protein
MQDYPEPLDVNLRDMGAGGGEGERECIKSICTYVTPAPPLPKG